MTLRRAAAVPQVAVLGGGVSVMALFEAIGAAELGPLDVRLHARRFRRAEVIAARAAELASIRRSGTSVAARADLRAAVDGADVVIVLVRIGGAAARRYDETFPSRYGLVGDEGLGLGGAANAWRTVPEIDRIAREVRRVAPSALVLNLVAPLGVTTRRFVEHELSTLGICELPTVTRERLEVADDGSTRGVGYVGLNHAGWFVPRSVADTAVPVRLRDAGLAAGLVDPETWCHFAGVPVPYHFRVLDPVAGERLGIRQPPGRADELAEMSEAVFAQLLEPGGPPPPSPRPTPWFDQALVPVVGAHLGGAPYRGTVNLPNGSLVDGVPGEVVVEVEATVDAASVSVVPPPPMPTGVRDLVGALARAEDHLHRASVGRDVRDLRSALAALPAALRPPAVDLDAALADVRAGELAAR